MQKNRFKIDHEYRNKLKNTVRSCPQKRTTLNVALGKYGECAKKSQGKRPNSHLAELCYYRQILIEMWSLWCR